MSLDSKIGVGLVGFGRLARHLLRDIGGAGVEDRLEVRALADRADPESIEYLVRFDSLLGRFPGAVKLEGDLLRLERTGSAAPTTAVRLLRETAPGKLDWRALGVDLVVECQIAGRTRADFAAHLAAGARRIVLCAPSAEPPDLTWIESVNERQGPQLTPEHIVISSASCTTHAAAPILRLLADSFGLRRAFVSAVHAYTDQDRLADVPDAGFRKGRAAAENIIPQTSRASQVFDQLLPDLRGRISSAAINVPVANGSAVDLTCWHEREVTVEAICETVRAACSGPLAGVIAYEDQPIVSSDVLLTRASGVFDAGSTMVLADAGGSVSKTLTWFDNGSGYAARAIDLLRRLAGFVTAEKSAVGEVVR